MYHKFDYEYNRIKAIKKEIISKKIEIKELENEKERLEFEIEYE